MLETILCIFSIEQSNMSTVNYTMIIINYIYFVLFLFVDFRHGDDSAFTNYHNTRRDTDHPEVPPYLITHNASFPAEVLINGVPQNATVPSPEIQQLYNSHNTFLTSPEVQHHFSAHNAPEISTIDSISDVRAVYEADTLSR